MKLIKSLAVAGIFAGSLVTAQSAIAVEVEANVGVASQYLFRGVDSANENPQLWGDIFVSYEGAYAGVWATNAEGTGEYDLIVGYGGEVDKFSYDINLTNYVYPELPDGEASEFAGITEVITTLGYSINDKASVEASYAHNITGDDGYTYTSIGGAYDKLSGLIGFTHMDDSADEYTHADVTYEFDELFGLTPALTVSKIIEQNNRGAGTDDNFNVVVGVSKSFKLH